MNIFTAQAQFLEATGKVLANNKLAPDDQIAMSEQLIQEEFEEWMDEDPGTVNDVKEALDLMYVTAQYLNSVIGPNKATRCLEALHENNMSKVQNAVLRDDGKVLKPKGYKKLDLTDIVMEGVE
ncbi:MAG: hypothetical protein OQK78_03890 [Gammaproteobacteria bacterium]|nr:hypothetical protein [Gammaproteobacteria bacterium]